jgi:cell division septal protein FtsQ
VRIERAESTVCFPSGVRSGRTLTKAGKSSCSASQNVIVTATADNTRDWRGSGTIRIISSVCSSEDDMLTLNGGQLASALQRVDPTLKTVTVGRHFFHTVVITATLRQPSLGWSTGDQDYLLDLDGTAIGPLPSGSTLPVVTDGSNLPVAVGQRVVPEQFVAFVIDLVPALKTDGYKVTGLSISDTTFDLTVSTNKGYQLIFDTTRAVGDEISDLKAVQALLVTQGKTPSQYIDLRIAGKAYWQ